MRKFLKTLVNSFHEPQYKAAAMEARRVEAYKKLFSGQGTEEDAEIVLADLAGFTGFFEVTGADFNDVEVRFREGQRSVFARVYNHLNLSNYEQQALAAAVRQEQVVNEQRRLLQAADRAEEG